MASVRELKDALEAEQTRAVDVADRSIAAIDTLLNLSMWGMTILGILVGLIALFGYGLIARSARIAAEKVATEKVESYIKSQEFADQIQRDVKEEVRRRVADKIILANLTGEKDDAPDDPFPAAPGGAK